MLRKSRGATRCICASLPAQEMQAAADFVIIAFAFTASHSISDRMTMTRNARVVPTTDLEYSNNYTSELSE